MRGGIVPLVCVIARFHAWTQQLVSRCAATRTPRFPPCTHTRPPSPLLPYREGAHASSLLIVPSCFFHPAWIVQGPSASIQSTSSLRIHPLEVNSSLNLRGVQHEAHLASTRARAIAARPSSQEGEACVAKEGVDCRAALASDRTKDVRERTVREVGREVKGHLSCSTDRSSRSLRARWKREEWRWKARGAT